LIFSFLISHIFQICNAKLSTRARAPPFSHPGFVSPYLLRALTGERDSLLRWLSLSPPFILRPRLLSIRPSAIFPPLLSLFRFQARNPPRLAWSPGPFFDADLISLIDGVYPSLNIFHFFLKLCLRSLKCRGQPSLFRSRKVVRQFWSDFLMVLGATGF